MLTLYLLVQTVQTLYLYSQYSCTVAYLVEYGSKYSYRVVTLLCMYSVCTEYTDRVNPPSDPKHITAAEIGDPDQTLPENGRHGLAL